MFVECLTKIESALHGRHCRVLRRQEEFTHLQGMERRLAEFKVREERKAEALQAKKVAAAERKAEADKRRKEEKELQADQKTLSSLCSKVLGRISATKAKLTTAMPTCNTPVHIKSEANDSLEILRELEKLVMKHVDGTVPMEESDQDRLKNVDEEVKNADKAYKALIDSTKAQRTRS